MVVKATDVRALRMSSTLTSVPSPFCCCRQKLPMACFAVIAAICDVGTVLLKLVGEGVTCPPRKSCAAAGKKANFPGWLT